MRGRITNSRQQAIYVLVSWDITSTDKTSSILNTEPFKSVLQATMSIKDTLQKQTAQAVLGLKTIEKVIEIDSQSSMVDAANLLWEYNLLAVPVWQDSDKKYSGFFDMRDILSAVLKATSCSDDDDEQYETLLIKALDELKTDGSKATLKDLAAKNPVFTCTPETSLYKLCEIMSDTKCHRVLVCEKGKDGTKCISIISQSTLVKYLAGNIPQEELDKPLDEAGLKYRKDIIGIKDTASARQAFELIDSSGLAGIAVVSEEDGALVGNTSARDIKLVALDKGNSSLDLDILSYLAAVRQEDSPHNGMKARYPACHVRQTSTVAHVLKLLAKTGYHRVFVTDEHLSPVGVISNVDVLKYIVKGE